MWKTAAIHTNIVFSHNFSQHVQIYLKNEHAKNYIICLTACFTVASQKDKVEASHAKISRNFSHHKNASTEPHNYPLNLFFTVNKNVVFF